MGQAINIIFDGPPGQDAPCFVEVETDDGKSINAGEWVRKGNYWALRITALPLSRDANSVQTDAIKELEEIAIGFDNRPNEKLHYKYVKRMQELLHFMQIKDDDNCN